MLTVLQIASNWSCRSGLHNMQMQHMRLRSAGHDLPARHCSRQALCSASVRQRTPQSRPASATVLHSKRGRQQCSAGIDRRRLVASATSRYLHSPLRPHSPSPAPTEVDHHRAPGWMRKSSGTPSDTDAGIAVAAAQQRRTSHRLQRLGRPAFSCSARRCEITPCLAGSFFGRYKLVAPMRSGACPYCRALCSQLPASSAAAAAAAAVLEPV